MQDLTTLEVGEAEAGLRLDVFLAGGIEDATRSFLKKLIKDGAVSINGQPALKPSHTMVLGDEIAVALPEPSPAKPEPENIPLEILFEDEYLLLVNKPAGLVVHPAPGHYTGTLVNAVLHHCPGFEWSGEMNRPGIVHRLDRYTSGVMVVAKTQHAFSHLAQQAASHSFERRYLALVRGEFKEETGRINAGIGRSLVDRSRMAVTGIRAKEAVTHFTVMERFGLASLVRLQLETGRTHQIRVHMRFAGRPVLGDPVYGVTDFRNWPISETLLATLDALEGQALHAETLGIVHPVSGEQITRTVAPPADFIAALDGLRDHLALSSQD
ncbi:MAG: RluA family pseudouridine synthase [Candidatus Hydrogenedentes bacterium]|nr:RluA family pseudouridine synthase [Candidatus Hydrogenedentota bacterium]